MLKTRTHRAEQENRLAVAAPPAGLTKWLRRDGYSLGLIAVVAWVANYLHFTQFGFYEDDWYYIAPAFVTSPKVWMTRSLWDQVYPPIHTLGRPLQLVSIHILAGIGALAQSIAVLYLLAFLLFTGSAVLMYYVLRHRFSRLVATLAAILFVVTPLHTLRQFLNGQFTFGPTFIVVFGAMLLYLRGRRGWAYIIAPVSLMCYESIFFIFVGVPLLRPGRIVKGRSREWLVHLAACVGIVIACFMVRKLLIGETRVAALATGDSLVWQVLQQWVFYIKNSFFLYWYGTAQAFGEGSLEAYLYVVLFCLALIKLLQSSRRGA